MIKIELLIPLAYFEIVCTLSTETAKTAHFVTVCLETATPCCSKDIRIFLILMPWKSWLITFSRRSHDSLGISRTDTYVRTCLAT